VIVERAADDRVVVNTQLGTVLGADVLYGLGVVTRKEAVRHDEELRHEMLCQTNASTYCNMRIHTAHTRCQHVTAYTLSL